MALEFIGMRQAPVVCVLVVRVNDILRKIAIRPQYAICYSFLASDICDFNAGLSFLLPPPVFYAAVVLLVVLVKE